MNVCRVSGSSGACAKWLLMEVYCPLVGSGKNVANGILPPSGRRENCKVVGKLWERCGNVGFARCGNVAATCVGPTRLRPLDVTQQRYNNVTNVGTQR